MCNGFHWGCTFKMASLSEVFPDLAKQWDYERNEGLTPDDVSYGSHKKVWWKCPICRHSYQKKIANRTAPAKRKAESDKCPICLGRVIIPGYNSLKAKYPDIIEKEWDFEKNIIDPDTIPPTYRKKMWWICPNGHNYHTLPGNKVYHTGGDCPYCSSQKLCRETSLGYLNPELVKEWCEENDKTPFEVTPGSDYEALWKCSNPNHPPYRCKVEIRTRGTGCVYCNRYGKKHPKDFEDELHAKFPHIRLLTPFTRMSDNVTCQCGLCGFIWKPTGNSLIKGKGCKKCKNKQ